jgi:ATP-binding cassette subfamily B protein
MHTLLKHNVPIRRNRLIRLLGFLGKWWPLYFTGLLGTGLQSFIFNFIIAMGLDGLANAGLTKNLSLLYRTLSTMGIQLLCIALALPLFEYSFQSSVKRLTANIRNTLFGHIQRLPLGYMGDSHSGDLLSRMTNDIQTAENAYSWQLGLLLMSVLSGIGSIIVILSLSWKMALIGIAIGGTCVLLNASFAKPIKKASDEVQQHLSDSSQSLTDILAGAQLAKIFNLSHRMFSYYASANLGIRTSAMRRTIYQSMLNGMNGIVSMMGFVGIIVAGSIMAMNGEIQFSQIIYVVQMMNGIIWMFTSIGNFIAQLQGSLAGADRIFEVLDISPEQLAALDSFSLQSSEAGRIPDEAGTAGKLDFLCDSKNIPVISFRGISFSYEADKTVLDKFHADMQQDHVTALVGLSGSGKSTIFKLLLRFYRPDSGDIALFNRDIRDYSLEELRSLIAYVPQESYLFSGTIRENIGYGREGASFEEIETAAKAAYADLFIRELPDGYDTQVGERGARLSGGQRQRIAIARALLKNAPILLLDEATASLDTESEQQVQKALEVLMKGRTTLVVAHRLSTIQNADRILVMENGRVCEEGTHTTLLNLNRVYARLHRIQLDSVSASEAEVV